MRTAQTLILLSARALAASSACRRDERPARAQAASAYPGAIVVDVSRIEFDDGDTFIYDDEPVRVLGIDTPEVTEPDVGIFEDQPFGRAAAESTRTLIVRARRVEIAYDGRDIYDRR